MAFTSLLSISLSSFTIRASELKNFLKSLDFIARKHNKFVLRLSLIFKLHVGELLLTSMEELALKLGVLAVKDRKLTNTFQIVLD